MATYKVLQDIEAEDKFLGPLTLKQCIFAAIAIVGAYLSFVLISRHIWVMALPLFPVIIVTGFLAFPWGRDQPTEVWLLAKIRFMFKPRKRIWDQSGIQELVRITAPPKIAEYLGDNLSQIEVKSRLRALADTIDSRGWAIKGASGQPDSIDMATTDRLVGPSSLPSVAASADNQVTDMFEGARANEITSRISATSTQHRTEAVTSMQQVSQPPANDYWFMQQPSADGMATFNSQSAAQPAATDRLSPMFNQRTSSVAPDEQQFLEQLQHKKQLQNEGFQNHKHIDPIDTKRPVPPVTPRSTPATISLARNNDRTIESIAREAGGDEVVVPLH